MLLILQKDNVVFEWRELIGPTSTKRAKEDFPRSIRALFGTDNLINAVFGSASTESVKTEIPFFFGNNNNSGIMKQLPFDEKDLESSASSSQKMLVLLKPDICNGVDGTSSTSKIVEEIVERVLWCKYQIVKREEFNMSADQARDFFEKYQDAEWFEELISFMASGPSLALVLRGEDVIKKWAEIMGPLDPAEARANAPMR